MGGSDSSVSVLPSPCWTRWEPVAFWSVSLLALLPLWLPAFPPMTDLPQHAAQVALFRDLLSGSSRWGDLLVVKWFTPYILGYALTFGLAGIFGVVAACKLIVSGAMLSTLWVTRRLLRNFESEPVLGWLCIFGLYGFSYQWGMISFMLAAPVGLYFVRILDWHEEAPGFRRGAVLSMYFVALFFCHALVLALCFVVAAVFWLGALPRRQRGRHLMGWVWERLWPLLGVMALALLWLGRSSGHASVSLPVSWDLGWWQTIEGYYSNAKWVLAYSGDWGRMTGLFPRVLGLRSVFIANLIGAGLLAAPFLLGYRPTLQRARLAPFVALVLCLLLMPSFVFGTAYVAQRYAIFMLPMYVLVFERAPAISATLRRRSIVTTLVAAAALAWVALFSTKAIEFDREARAFRQATSQVTNGGRVLSLVFSHDDEQSMAPTLLHLPTWLSATRGSLVDAGFTGTHIQLVVYRPGLLPKASVVDHFEWMPDRFDWQLHQGDQYDFFVIRSSADMAPRLFRGAPCAPRRVSAQQGWWLYERAEKCGK